jgi:hypothetical protein
MTKIFLILFFFATVNVFPQSMHLTKDADNGYAWERMEAPAQYYSTSKETYLSSILERYRLTKEKHPEVSSLSCKEDINKLYAEGKSDKISISDIVGEIDKFYSEEQNMIVPIIFAYCYTIKKFSGASEVELSNYKNKVLDFCKE